MIRTVLFFLGILFAQTASSEQLVVIKSNTQAFSAGQLIDGAASVSLNPGESLSLVSSAGKTIWLDGPYDGQPAPADPSEESTLLDSLSKIVTESSQATILAVFRNVNKKHSPWTVKAGKSGIYCLPGASSTVISRPKPYDKIEYTITIAQSGERITESWRSGESETPWPESIILLDNATYNITLPGQVSADITVRLLPAGSKSPAHRIVWMWETGCKKQSRQLLNEL
jgi:hypothetical protein